MDFESWSSRTKGVGLKVGAHGWRVQMVELASAEASWLLSLGARELYVHASNLECLHRLLQPLGFCQSV